jgi:hypothetical protein
LHCRCRMLSVLRSEKSEVDSLSGAPPRDFVTANQEGSHSQVWHGWHGATRGWHRLAWRHVPLPLIVQSQGRLLSPRHLLHYSFTRNIRCFRHLSCTLVVYSLCTSLVPNCSRFCTVITSYISVHNKWLTGKVVGFLHIESFLICSRNPSKSESLRSSLVHLLLMSISFTAFRYCD